MYYDHLLNAWTDDYSYRTKDSILYDIIDMNVENLNEKKQQFLLEIIDNLPETIESVNDYLYMANINTAIQESLYLGNLDAKRDWGYAPEYCLGMWLMMQKDKPDDYILATGNNHTIREFVELSFKELDINIEWKGRGKNEIGLDSNTGKKLIGIDEQYYRPTEVEQLLGDPTKAKNELSWESKTSFKDLVRIMVHADWEKVKKRGY